MLKGAAVAYLIRILYVLIPKRYPTLVLQDYYSWGICKYQYMAPVFIHLEFCSLCERMIFLFYFILSFFLYTESSFWILSCTTNRNIYHVQTRIRLRSVILLYSVLYYLAYRITKVPPLSYRAGSLFLPGWRNWSMYGVPWSTLVSITPSISLPPHRYPAYYPWTGNGVWAWPGGIYVCTLKSIAYLTLATEYSVHKWSYPIFTNTRIEHSWWPLLTGWAVHDLPG